MKDDDIFSNRRRREEDFFYRGRLVGYKIARFKMKLLWRLQTMRKKAAERAKKKAGKRPLVGQFVQGWIDGAMLPWIFCDTCETPGFDYRSESHGWQYHGGHIWTCKACEMRKREGEDDY